MSGYRPILRSLSLLVATLSVRGVEIQEIAISDSEGGASLSEAHHFAAGDHLFLSFKIGDFRVSEEPRRADLEYSITATDDLGLLLTPVHHDKVDVEITPEDKHWRPHAVFEVEVPAYPRNAQHKFTVVVQDKLAKQEAKADVPFQVGSAWPDPPASLSLYRLQLFRAADKQTPVDAASVWKAGEAIAARFAITGYHLDEKNTYSVEYGLRIETTAGKVLLSVPKAAEESSSSFYPQRFVPCALEFNLAPQLAPGDYVLSVSAKDRIGNQDTQSELRLTVR